MSTALLTEFYLRLRGTPKGELVSVTAPLIKFDINCSPNSHIYVLRIFVFVYYHLIKVATNETVLTPLHRSPAMANLTVQAP